MIDVSDAEYKAWVERLVHTCIPFELEKKLAYGQPLTRAEAATYANVVHLASEVKRARNHGKTLARLDEIEACLAGRFPGAASDIVFTEEELALYEKLINSNDEVFAVSADGYTNSPGPIGFRDLLRQDAAADYMSGDLSVQSAQPADLNGDGRPEYVLFLSTADGNSRLCCCLSEQDGRVYAYLLSYYAPDAAVDSNGNLYFAAQYYQELYRLVFDGEEALSLMLPLEYYMP